MVHFDSEVHCTMGESTRISVSVEGVGAIRGELVGPWCQQFHISFVRDKHSLLDAAHNFIC